jgi:hypothetical protein
MAERSAYDKERIAHINFLMDQINDRSNEIYESLVDREYPEVKKQVSNLISLLRDISASVEDDI